MFSEASSGAYGPARPVLMGQGRAALRRMGYRRDKPTENLHRSVLVDDPPRVEAAADLMRETPAAAS